MDLSDIDEDDLVREMARRNKIKEKQYQDERYARYKAEQKRVTDILRNKVRDILGLTRKLNDDELGDIVCAVQEYEENHP